MGRWNRSDIERSRWLNHYSDAPLAICQRECLYFESRNASMYFWVMRYDRLFYIDHIIRWRLSAILDNDYNG